MNATAVLALADGTVFRGQSIGALGQAVGEVVFNTAMTGYQEILTDPSYRAQIITLTFPHIGNVGVNSQDMESTTVHSAGLVIRDLPPTVSNWRSTSTLPDFLASRDVVAIAGVDTRELTRRLRQSGAQSGCILAADDVDSERAVSAAMAFPGLAGLDLAKVVSVESSYPWSGGAWGLDRGFSEGGDGRFKVVAYDFGIKHNILRELAERHCDLTVVPAATPAKDVMSLAPDGVFLSNGPGDPEPCDYAVAAIRELLSTGVPIFGICLGHQLLALACGASTKKMKFGHHGANHPVKDLVTGVVLISSQNHGFAVDEASLPPELIATHRSLFDGSLQGVHHKSLPAFGFQGHPEASPGPHDTAVLFEHFIELMERPRVSRT